jgi:sialidase-1
MDDSMMRLHFATAAMAAAILATAIPVGAVDLLTEEHLAFEGDSWVLGDSSVKGSGTGQFLETRQAIGPGNFRIQARLSLENVANSAASFHINRESNFGFSSRSGVLFVDGPAFGLPGNVAGDKATLITDGEPFDFTVQRRGDQLSVSINGENVYTAFGSIGPLGPFGFRPWRSTMTIDRLEYTGELISREATVAALQQDDTYTRIETPTQELFVSGENDYAAYRIPAIVRTNGGALLAFAEGRKKSTSDTGDIDLLLRRSTDGGRTWSPQQLVWSDDENTCGNPAPVVDRNTGRVLLLSTWNKGTDVERTIMDGTSEDTRRVFVLHSDDEGLTWSDARDITKSVKEPHWRWYATGPCHGIQMEDGTLVIPANHSDHTGSEDAKPFDYYRAHLVISEDGGETWRHSAVVGPRTNESTVAELPGGRLVMNMRSYENINRRAVAWTNDKGATWSKTWLDPDLVEPRCQASLLRLDRAEGPLFLFSNPEAATRTRMTVTWSTDNMRTWQGRYLAEEGFSAYSDMVDLADGSVGLYFERDNYNLITFQRIALDEMLAAPRTAGSLVP